MHLGPPLVAEIAFRACEIAPNRGMFAHGSRGRAALPQVHGVGMLLRVGIAHA